MAERSITIPQTRLDFARILKGNDNNISQTIVKLEEYFELDLAKRDSLHGILSRVRDTIRKSKKSIDSMGGEWWNSVVFLEHDLKKRHFSSDADTENSSVHHRKSIDNLSLKQQRSPYQMYYTLSEYLLRLKTFQKSRLLHSLTISF